MWYQLLEWTESFLHSALKLLLILRAMMSFLWDSQYQLKKEQLSDQLIC